MIVCRKPRFIALCLICGCILLSGQTCALAQELTIPQHYAIPEEISKRIRDMPKDVGELIIDLWHVNAGNRDWARDRLVKIGEAAIPALVAAMREDSYEEIDKNLPPNIGQKHQKMMARHYYVQHTASEALSGITKINWGFVFNEDYSTWAAWLETTNRAKFDPASIPRTDKERRHLIEQLLHRYLSGRPNPWQSSHLEENDAVVAIAHNLQQLQFKPSELRRIVKDACAAAPIWQHKLTVWLDKLLIQMVSKDNILEQ